MGLWRWVDQERMTGWWMEKKRWRWQPPSPASEMMLWLVVMVVAQLHSVCDGRSVGKENWRPELIEKTGAPEPEFSAAIAILHALAVSSEEDDDGHSQLADLASLQQQLHQYEHDRGHANSLGVGEGSDDGESEQQRESSGLEEAEDLLVVRQRRRRRRQRAASKGVEGVPGIALSLAQRGLTYTKEVLVGQVLKQVIPLHVPDVEMSSSSDIGEAKAIVRNLILSALVVPDSAVDLSSGCVTFFAAGLRAHVSFDWKYTLTNPYFPFPVSDEGNAFINVSGVQSGVTFNLTESNGTLAIHVLDCGSVIDDLQIVMKGRISWLYNWFVQTFSGRLKVAVQDALTKGVRKAVGGLDNYLQGLPRQLPIDTTAAVDVTIISNPVVAPQYLAVGTKGEFVSVSGDKVYTVTPPKIPLAGSCGGTEKMITLAISDYVLRSASAVYHAAGAFHWSVTELPDESPLRLNTSSWRFMLPQLYFKYPNRAIVLDVRVSSPPSVTLTEEGIKADTEADLTIQVVGENNVSVSVACLTMAISFDGLAGIQDNNITGRATLEHFDLVQKWSDIGRIPVVMIQVAVRTVMKGIIMPTLNFHLKTGFPLPVIPGVFLRRAEIKYAIDYLIVCTDAEYLGTPPNDTSANPAAF